MKKKQFESPEVKVIELNLCSILCESGCPLECIDDICPEDMLCTGDDCPGDGPCPMLM